MGKVLKSFLPTVIALLALFVMLATLNPDARIAAQSDSTFTNVRVSQDLRLQPATTITATASATLVARGSYQPLSAASNVTIGSITPDIRGTLLVLTNVSTPTITIPDSGVLKLGAARALGQYDTLYLISDGSNWLELAFGNN